MNPEKNMFEALMGAHAQEDPIHKEIKKLFDFEFDLSALVKADGTPVPEHWTTFHIDEDVVIKGYTFRVKYIGETSILFEPVGIPKIQGEDPKDK